MRIGRPPIDIIQVKGLSRTRQPVVIDLVDLTPRALLTTSRHSRAARRLHELPSAALTRLSYRPLAGDLAEIEAVVVERPAIPRGVARLAATAVAAWLHRELRLDVAAPTGSESCCPSRGDGGRARGSRRDPGRRAAVLWLPGVTTIEGSWERQSYATPTISRDERRRGGVACRLEPPATCAGERVALDRWARDSHVAADAAIDLRLAGDRLSFGVDAAGEAPIGSTARFASGGVSSAWRSAREGDCGSWTIAAGSTPRALPRHLICGRAPGRDTRAPLLRAHPLAAGVVNGPAFGRRLAHATVEYQHPLLVTPAGSIRLAAFADTAKPWRQAGIVDRGPWHADVGLGLRLRLPAETGTLRVDVARGLKDGRTVLSAGWQAPWPGRAR
jgi:hypothetical protein